MSPVLRQIRLYYQCAEQCRDIRMRQNRDITGDYLDLSKTPFAEPLRCGTSQLEGDAAVIRQLEACRRAWEGGGEPLALARAVTLTRGIGRTTPGWLEEGLVAFILARRTADEAEFHREKTRHAMRYLAVRDFRRQGFSKDEAIDRAVQKLQGTAAFAARDTTLKSYARVRSDIKNDRALGEYFPADEGDDRQDTGDPSRS
jgi:hypothetical protein